MEKDKTIIEYGKIIYSRRWVIIILMAAIFSFTLVNTLLTEKGYTAKTTIFPTTVNQGGLASFLSNPLAGIVKQDANVLIVLLKSQNLAEKVTQKLKLEDRFLTGSEKRRKMNGFGKAVSILKSKIKAYSTKDGAVEISIELNDPRLSENVCRAYVDSVSEYLNSASIPINFVVIDPPRASNNPSSPNMKANLMTALIVSIVLGVSFSLLDDYFWLVLK